MRLGNRFVNATIVLSDLRYPSAKNRVLKIKVHRTINEHLGEKRDNGQFISRLIKFAEARQDPLRSPDSEPVRNEELIGTIERASERVSRAVFPADCSSENERRTGTMKNAHPIVRATTSSPVGPDSTGLDESAEPIIRLKLQKPLHWEWELTTSADALPVIQLLDKNGRLLVETTGRTAQRARGSFKKGLRTHEQFLIDESRVSLRSKEPTSSASTSSTSASFIVTPFQGNRNIDGFSSKFGTCNFAPRKSRSEVCIKEGRSKKKRHSSATRSSEDPTMKTMKIERNIEESTIRVKRYSAGDYLRQQIVNDLHTRGTIDETPEEIAKDRCKKVKAYLRSQSETLLSLVREEESGGNETKNSKIKSNEKYSRSRGLMRSDTANFEKKISSEESKPTRESYPRSAVIPVENSASTSNERRDKVIHKIKYDMSEEELLKIRTFLREKIQQRMNMEQARSRSAVRADVSETVESSIERRYSDYSHEDNRRNYRTRKVRSETSILRFDPEVLEKEEPKSCKQLEREETASYGGFSEAIQFQKRTYWQSRGEALVEAAEPDDRPKPRLKRESSSANRKKLYRKTKSDVLLGQAAAISVDSDKDAANPPRRIKSQENVERSWREYKERKRSERFRKESEREAPEEDDFMNKPRWKDLQRDLCSSRNCKVCQNLRNCVNPFHEQSEESHRETEESTMRKEVDTKDDETSLANSSRPGTSLQENYLLVEEKNERLSPIIARIQMRNRNDVGSVSALGVNSPDFGYNSIPSKSAFKDYRELYARSNVKKSDTFKIVDGSENLEECTNGYDSKINGGDGSDSDLGYLNAELANKSNEDITRDYFERVYELLKKRQEEMRKLADGNRDGYPGQDDSSSSNYVEKMQKKRQRRRKKDKSSQGEDVVTVPSTSSGRNNWKVQRLSVNKESPQSSNRRRGCNRSQLQPVVSGNKKNRPAPPPPPAQQQPTFRRVNAKDQVDRYFDWPNKENTPGNAVIHHEDNQTNQLQTTEETMGSNLSRHNGKGLTGRRTQSSGNLCDPKGKLNTMGKILVPCSSAQKERYKFCGSLPNHLDDKDALDDDERDNNNIMSDTIDGNYGGTLPHKKRSLGVHFSDSGPTGTLDLVKHRSQDSLDENDPWRYQQSDLDLVRCRHGNFDSVKRNRSADTVLVDSAGRYGRSNVSSEDRCLRNSDLDLVGALPKRKQDAGNNSGRSLESSQPCIINVTDVDDDLLLKIHKPDCELIKHRQQFGKCVDLKLSKLVSGEPQDQGYASERSPEDEHPPSLPGVQPFPSVTPESTFRVTLQKSSRGLGLSLSGGGTAGPVRVKRLFPQQPAALSNKLQTGDILLAANGIPLTGLTNYEALEVLRTTPSTVELVVCRLPGDSNVTPPGAPPPPPARREPRLLNPLPPLQIEPCGEFDIDMTKVGGSLGFTLRKADSSALGHYVRALVREPALSDGRIRPGDKIVAVDGAPLSPMSHEEAVQLLRQCGPTVKLRLYRDLAQTPVSALSPTEPDHPLRPPRTSLRQEAVDMLCDLAVRKLSPGTSSGSSSSKQQSSSVSCNSPRRLRRLATRTPPAETDQEIPESKLHDDVQTTSSTASQPSETASDSDQCSVRTQITISQTNTPATDIIDPPPLYDIRDEENDDDESQPKSTLNNLTAARPSFLDLSAPQGKPHFQFCSIDSDSEYPDNGDVILAETERGRLAEPSYGDDRSVTILSSDERDNDLPSEPASMPPVLSSTSSGSTTAFSYKNPAYQSANPACGGSSDPTAPKSKVAHSSDQDIPGKILGTDDPGGSKGLLKWKGVMFAPNDEVDQDAEYDREDTGKDITDSVAPAENHEQGSEVFMVELTRGWNSRLGFSLQPEGKRTVISVVHPDSVAAKDGRLKQGDVLLMVNEESVEHMSTADIIDLLRKIRGSIGITVMRRSKRENVT